MNTHEVLSLEKEPGKDIIRIQSGKALISKDQQSFNKLVKKIEKLQQQIREDKETLDRVLAIYLQEIIPRITKISRAKIAICHLLDAKRDMVKLSPLQNQKLDGVIFSFLSDAFCITDPDNADRKLHKKYHSTFFDEILRNLSIPEEWLDAYGDDDDYDKTGNYSDEEETKSEQRHSEYSKKKDNHAHTVKDKKKSGKQQKNETLQKQKEVIKTKSLRNIYLSLVRLLHPDKERDEVLKKDKEELMKDVITAYENRNLYRLLELEIKWIKKYNTYLSGIDEKTLSTYLELMKEQVKTLNQELDSIWFHPQYRIVSHPRFLVFGHSREMANHHIREYDQFIEFLNKHINDLQGNKRNASSIKECINEYSRYPDRTCFEGSGGLVW